MRKSRHGHDTTFDRASSPEKEESPPKYKPKNEDIPPKYKSKQNEDIDIDPLEAADYEEQLLKQQNLKKKIHHSEDDEEDKVEDSLEREEYERQLLEQHQKKQKMRRTSTKEELKQSENPDDQNQRIQGELNVPVGHQPEDNIHEHDKNEKMSENTHEMKHPHKDINNSHKLQGSLAVDKIIPPQNLSEPQQIPNEPQYKHQQEPPINLNKQPQTNPESTKPLL